MWWALSNLNITPAGITTQITSTTSEADHCYVAYAPWEPARHPIYRTFRGRTHICGYSYIWDTPTVRAQDEPGDTYSHTFSLDALTPLTTYWAYIFAPDGPYGLEIQGPLFSWVTEAYEPGPQPIPNPIYWICPNFIHRCGNHYTWYSEGSWYCLVPTSFSLRMYKLVEGVMLRQDLLNEPEPPAGVIADADSRVRPAFPTIHAAYYCALPAPGPHLLRYAVFDTASDTWLLDEPICQPVRQFNGTGQVSLSLDATAVPHVIYTDGTAPWFNFDYRNRIGGAWGAAEPAIHNNFRFLFHCSADHAPATNTFHAFCYSNFGEHFINARTDLGVWAGRTNLATLGRTSSMHSIATGVELPHFGQTMPTHRMSHHEGVPPYPHQDDLSAPVSRWASMISSPAPLAHVAMIFSDNTGHLAHVYRPPAQPWNPEVALDPAQVSVVAATYNHADVCSALWWSLGPFDLGFWAFDAPWV